jgi:predicted DsbA family dithiol-disulfide isomerase
VPAVKVTYFREILSSWCHWAEPAWTELQRRYAGRVAFDWKIALMNPGDFPASREQCEWFYRRSGGTVMQSPYMLNSGWFEAGRQGDYSAPNRVAEAARDLGVTDDSVCRALTAAALIDGRKIGDLAEAVAVAAAAGRLDPHRLRARAEAPEIRSRVAACTAEFFTHQVTQRPAFLVEDVIGDRAMVSGLVRLEPLAALVEAMLGDTAAYAAHAAHHGPVPAA